MEILLVRPKNNDQLKAIKTVLKAMNIYFISLKEENYDTAFVKKITDSHKEAKQGKITKISTENLWK